MSASLRNRLIFGPLMLAALWGILDFDRQIERWTRGWIHTPAGTFGLAGVGIFLMLMLLLPLATQELATLFTRERVRPYRGIAGVGSGLLMLHAFLTQFGWFQQIAASALAFVLVAVMIMAALRRAWGRNTNEAITHMAGTMLATLYLGGLAWFLLALRVKHSTKAGGFQGSTAVVFMILLVVKFADIGAFFIGSRFGRHKLIPWLSPKKSWEGLLGGVATAAVVGLICARIWPDDLVTIASIPKALIFGGIIGAVGQAGDLLESLMKRDAEMKDSGQLVPGFGGLLDIIDSPLLAAPVAYLLFSVF
jgi:phosphatidate cytidylyltransferase